MSWVATQKRKDRTEITNDRHAGVNEAKEQLKKSKEDWVECVEKIKEEKDDKIWDFQEEEKIGNASHRKK